MLEILKSCWLLVSGLAESLLGMAILIGTWGYEILSQLHVGAPRLEGLLVGILLAWLMIRRDKHPILRVLSAPLKLVVDILDLAWNQAVEVVSDLWSTLTSWVGGIIGWLKEKIVSGYDRVIKFLKSIKEKIDSLDKKEDKK